MTLTIVPSITAVSCESKIDDAEHNLQLRTIDETFDRIDTKLELLRLDIHRLNELIIRKLDHISNALTAWSAQLRASSRAFRIEHGLDVTPEHTE